MSLSTFTLAFFRGPALVRGAGEDEAGFAVCCTIHNIIVIIVNL